MRRRSRRKGLQISASADGWGGERLLFLVSPIQVPEWLLRGTVTEEPWTLRRKTVGTGVRVSEISGGAVGDLPTVAASPPWWPRLGARDETRPDGASFALDAACANVGYEVGSTGLEPAITLLGQATRFSSRHPLR